MRKLQKFLKKSQFCPFSYIPVGPMEIWMGIIQLWYLKKCLLPNLPLWPFKRTENLVSGGLVSSRVLLFQQKQRYVLQWLMQNGSDWCKMSYFELVWEAASPDRLPNEPQAIMFLSPSVRQEVKGLSELLLWHFSDILMFLKICKANKAQILSFWPQ